MDLTLDLGERCLNIRAAALVRHQEKILLCRIGDSCWFLPGGRVQFGESSRTAIERELEEEIGPGFILQDALIHSENFFILKGQPCHEVCTYYTAIWPEGRKIPETAERQEEFRWVPLSDLPGMDLKPDFLIPVLQEPPDRPLHIIHRDRTP